MNSLSDITRSLSRMPAISSPATVTEARLDNPFIEHPATFRDTNHGEQWVFEFPNGWGASVVRSGVSYGADEGLWELAVLDGGGDLSYDTDITDDVIGYQSETDVAELLRRIALLDGDGRETLAIES